MRKIVLTIIGVLLILGSILAARSIIRSNNKPEPEVKKIIKTVFTDTAENTEVPITITANGNLVAKNRIELYAEVQGVFNQSSKLFKAGQPFKRGELLIGINSDEYYTSVQSAKSDLYNQITAIMPDLRLDYPEVLSEWQQYLQNFDINKSVPPLPEKTSERAAYFINGRGINTAYYSVKNLEQRLSKYRIYAPFDGIVTEALVTKGTLVRNGQKLGEYIDPSSYEIEIAVEKRYSDLLAIGQEVRLHSIDQLKEYTGKVSRINGRIDQATQTVKVYIDIKGDNLKEGMYLEADLEARKVPDAIKMPRKLLVDDSNIFILRDSILDILPVDPVYFSAKDMVVTGVPDGTRYLTRAVPGAYAGMLVKESTDSQTSQSTQLNSSTE